MLRKIFTPQPLSARFEKLSKWVASLMSHDGRQRQDPPFQVGIIKFVRPSDFASMYFDF